MSAGRVPAAERSREPSASSGSTRAPSSRVRAKRGRGSRTGEGEARAALYLRALGMSDDASVLSLVTEATRDAGRRADPVAVLASLRARIARVVTAITAGPGGRSLDPLFLRRLAFERPDVFVDGALPPAEIRRIAEELGDPESGRIRGARSMPTARLEADPRARFVLAALGVTLGATGLLAYALSGVAGLALASLALVTTILWAHAAASIASAALGFWRRRAARAPGPRRREGALPPMALLMPVYHESPSRVLGAAVAMREELLREPGTEHVEIFVLSDSRDVARAAAEERAVRRVAPVPGAPIPIRYRRRARNDHKKSGNIAEFLERWGGRFELAAVLDADSLVRGRTLAEMAWRMVEDPQLGLLQAPIEPQGGTTLFARWQQLSAWLVGPLATAGLRAWAGDHGNYFGHNAVLRVRAFTECCGLPELPGRAPLGGPILSHDFVEAALLVRGGWAVRNADDLRGSYEELPQSFGAFVERDRRWCQGNLQHLRVALAKGLRARSRAHLVLGALGYLAAPLWATFLGLALVVSVQASSLAPWLLWALLAATLGLHAVPRALAVLDVLLDARRRHAFGPSVIASAITELALGALVAPLFMVAHTAIVIGIVTGRGASWGAQARDADRGLAFAEARMRAGSALFGALIAIGCVWAGPLALLWLAPVWAPLLLSPFVAASLASRRLGAWCARLGLFVVPPEREGDALLDHAAELRARLGGDAAGRFRDLVLDPALAATRATDGETDASTIVERALRGGPTALGDAERDRLASDPCAMRALHEGAWVEWPVEEWRGHAEAAPS